MKESKLALSGMSWFLVGLCQMVGVLALLSPVLVWIYVLLLLAFVVAVVIDLRSLGHFQGNLGIHTHDLSLTLGESKDSHWELASLGLVESLPSGLLLWQALPNSLVSIEPEKVKLEIPIGSKECRFIMKLTAKQLGESPYGDGFVIQTSSLKLWRKLVLVKSQAGSVKVGVCQAKIPEIEFKQILNQPQIFLGVHVRSRHQSPDLFYGYREYRYPDAMRMLDQKKYARQGVLLTKLFESMSRHHLILAFDLGRSMAGLIQGSAKIDYYWESALNLLAYALSCQDQVSCFGFSQTVHFQIREANNLQLLVNLYQNRRGQRYRDEESNFALIEPIIQGLSQQRSLVVLFTDICRPSIQAQLLKNIKTLAQKHLVVVIGILEQEFQIEENLQNIDFEKDPTQEQWARLVYCYRMREDLERFRKQINLLGAGCVVTSERYFYDMVQKTYSYLRQSLRA